LLLSSKGEGEKTKKYLSIVPLGKLYVHIQFMVSL